MPLRLLFTCRPLTGHYLPLVPLAVAAREAGHEVAFATGQPILDQARAEGFEALPAGAGAEIRAAWAPRFAGFERLVGDAQRRFFFTNIFADVELAPRARDLDAIVHDWRPDVVVHEVAELAAPLVCSAAGVPYADVAYGSLVPLAILEAAGAAAGAHWRARGLEPDRYAGLFRHLYVDTCPPAMQTGEIDAITSVQQLRPAAATTLPSARGSGRPTVYVTMGTVWNRNLEVFRQVFAALADRDIDVVATVGRDNDPEQLGPVPANVTVHRWIAQEELLPRCDLVIAHGGAGTTLGALAHGVPLLVIPQGADQWSNAERVVAAGAGRSFVTDDDWSTSETLRATITELLDRADYRDTARAIAKQIAAMPTAADALRALERLPARRS